MKRKAQVSSGLKMYLTYIEGAAQPATQRFAKSDLNQVKLCLTWFKSRCEGVAPKNPANLAGFFRILTDF
jgi:hypothetical protein